MKATLSIPDLVVSISALQSIVKEGLVMVEGQSFDMTEQLSVSIAKSDMEDLWVSDNQLCCGVICKCIADYKGRRYYMEFKTILGWKLYLMRNAISHSVRVDTLEWVRKPYSMTSGLKIPFASSVLDVLLKSSLVERKIERGVRNTVQWANLSNLLSRRLMSMVGSAFSLQTLDVVLSKLQLDNTGLELGLSIISEWRNDQPNGDPISNFSIAKNDTEVGILEVGEQWINTSLRTHIDVLNYLIPTNVLLTDVTMQLSRGAVEVVTKVNGLSGSLFICFVPHLLEKLQSLEVKELVIKAGDDASLLNRMLISLVQKKLTSAIKNYFPLDIRYTVREIEQLVNEGIKPLNISLADNSVSTFQVSDHLLSLTYQGKILIK